MNKLLSDDDLEKIEVRAKAAPPGPLTYKPEDGGPNYLVGTKRVSWAKIKATPGRYAVADAELFANARADMITLLTEIRRRQRVEVDPCWMQQKG